MKIDKALYDEMIADTVTKKRYDEIKKIIHARVHEIVMYMCDNKYNWYDFSNEGGTDVSPGWFDPIFYKTEICLTGSIKFPEPYDTLYFPTRWLWEDFEEEFKQTVSNNVDVKKEKARLVTMLM